MASRISQIDRLEQITNYVFKDKALAQSAITHPSAVEGEPIWCSYERLEFLGDSILGALVATDLFERYHDMDEGCLTRMKIALVSGNMLSEVAGELGLGECIIFGGSERGTHARGMHSALENVYEAVVGALYLDGVAEPAHAFVERTLEPRMSRHLAATAESPKSLLQEVTQRDFKCAPSYKLIGQEGPAHSPTFTSVVLVDGKRVGRGSGSSKKEAESMAALAALRHLGYVPAADEEARE